jgi:hypothetical protein
MDEKQRESLIGQAWICNSCDLNAAMLDQQSRSDGVWI